MADAQIRQRAPRSSSPAAKAPAKDKDAAQKDGIKAEWHTEDVGFIGILCVAALMVFTPLMCYFTAYLTNSPDVQNTSFTAIGKAISAQPSVGQFVIHALSFPGMGTYDALIFFLGFNSLALVLYWLPGEVKYGPVTAKGQTPEYKDNGVLHCFLFTLIFILASNGLGAYSLGLFDLGIIYDVFPGLVAILNIFGLAFCGLLYIKGLTFPSGPDNGKSGNGFIFDYYWGTELYPRFFNVDVKKFVNCRFSMSFWQLAGISFAYRSYTLHGKWDPAIVLCALSQYLYLVKFFIWEIGYMRSIDIIVDRAGFYETWGCLNWVPAIYTFHTRALVKGVSGLSWLEAGLIFAVGILGVGFNWWADTQRMVFREKNGKCNIWGKPAVSVEAKYLYVEDAATGRTKERTTQLLASGFWGMARHFQYTFELTAAWSWGLLGAGGFRFPNGILPLFYAIFLTILLIHRERRDHDKCAAKYGKAWDEYCKLVPSRILPGIY
jgi:7-dehydrocholesterol reductase